MLEKTEFKSEGQVTYQEDTVVSRITSLSLYTYSLVDPSFKSRGPLVFFFMTLEGGLLITSSWQHPRQVGGPLSA